MLRTITSAAVAQNTSDICLVVTWAQSSSNVKSATLPQVLGAVSFLVPSTCIVLGPGWHSASSVCEIINCQHWQGFFSTKTAYPVNQPCFTDTEKQ